MDSNDPRSADIITVQNVDTEPIDIIYDGKSWGTIVPGQIRRFPRFLAEHAVKHLIDQILNRLEKPTNNKVLRQEWASKIVIDEESTFQPRALTAEEKLQKEVEQLNKQSDLELVLNRARASQAANAAPVLDQTPPAPAPVPATPVVLPVDTNTPPPAPAVEQPIEPPTPAPVVETPAPVVNPDIPATPPVTENPVSDTPPAAEDAIDTTDNVAEEAPVDPSLPTREALYGWARDNMHMNIEEPKTKAALDATPIPQLVEDLQYAP
jgi:hypothetical protein